MTRFLSLLASFAMAFLLIGGVSSASFAAAPPAYRFIPTSVSAGSGTMIAGDIMWKPTANGYVSVNANARPAIACAQAARVMGKAAAFHVDGTEMSAEALAKCNAKAK